MKFFSWIDLKSLVFANTIKKYGIDIIRTSFSDYIFKRRFKVGLRQ